MIKTTIDKSTNTGKIQATGSVPELLNDLAILIGGIYRQFQGADPTIAKLFQYGLTGMVNDQNGPVWNGDGNQIGFAFKTN